MRQKESTWIFPLPVNFRREMLLQTNAREKINQIQFQQPTKFHNITREKQCVLHNLQKCQDIVINLHTKAEQYYFVTGNIILY